MPTVSKKYLMLCVQYGQYAIAINKEKKQHPG